MKDTHAYTHANRKTFKHITHTYLEFLTSLAVFCSRFPSNSQLLEHPLVLSSQHLQLSDKTIDDLLLLAGKPLIQLQKELSTFILNNTMIWCNHITKFHVCMLWVGNFSANSRRENCMIYIKIMYEVTRRSLSHMAEF